MRRSTSGGSAGSHLPHLEVRLALRALEPDRRDLRDRPPVAARLGDELDRELEAGVGLDADLLDERTVVRLERAGRVVRADPREPAEREAGPAARTVDFSERRVDLLRRPACSGSRPRRPRPARRGARARRPGSGRRSRRPSSPRRRRRGRVLDAEADRKRRARARSVFSVGTTRGSSRRTSRRRARVVSSSESNTTRISNGSVIASTSRSRHVTMLSPSL